MHERIEIVQENATWSWIYYSKSGAAACRSMKTFASRTGCIENLVMCRKGLPKATALMRSAEPSVVEDVEAEPVGTEENLVLYKSSPKKPKEDLTV